MLSGRGPPLGALGVFLSPGHSRSGQLWMIRRLWRSYARNLIVRPLTTRCWTSVLGMVSGELLAQAAQGNEDIDVANCVRVATYAFFVQGPSTYVFYGALDKIIMPRNPMSVLAVATKILIDQAAFSPAMVCSYYGAMNTLEGRPWDAKNTICEKFWPTMTAAYTFWVPAQIVNFRFVADEYRVPVILAFSVAWNAILSTVASTRHPAPETPLASLQVGAGTGSPLDNFIVRTGLQIANISGGW